MGARREFLAAMAAQFTAGVKVVSVLAAVRDRVGAYIRDLDKDDFTLFENGHPQSIAYFSRESDLPLVLGLMVDTSMSQERVMAAQRGAAFRFLDQVLREGTDQVFVMQFDMGVFLAHPLTSNRKSLDDALSLVDTPTRAELSVPTSRGTLLYDALVKASREIMAAQSGRKAIILLTDGVDVGSQATLADSIDAALRADTILYPILFTGGNGGARGVLRRMALETGGNYLEVTRSLNISQAFERVQLELRSQYSIGYVSDDPVRMEGFRRIDLRAKRAGLTVQARTRYWAVP
jgi:VWFA-related protein